MNTEKTWFTEVINNFRTFAPQYLKIKNKDGEIVPFIFNKAQETVYRIVERLKKERKPIRLIVLKARQKGISTLFEGEIFHRTSFQYYRKAAIVGHKVDATNNLYAMTKRYFKYLPDELKPEIEASNEKVLKYGKLESEIKLYTAESGDVGSSDTIQDLHLTEVAKWRDPKTTLTALLQTVPLKPNTMIVMESTALGIGGEFYDRWQMAESGESNYVPIFLSWLIDDEYTLPFRDEEEKYKLQNSIDEIEYGLREAGATWEHLNWRRKVGVPDNCGNDVDMFRQEYPSNAIEAFVASGSPVFDVKKCYIYFQESDKYPIVKGNLEYTDDVHKNVVFTENERGYLTVFDRKYLDSTEIKPEESYRFAAGCDVAEGLAQGDYSLIEVMDRKENADLKPEVAMSWRGHIDPDLLAEEIHKLQLFLKNKVFFGIEKNNHGYTTIKSAYKLNVNLYYAQSFDKGYPSDSGKIGFTTTGKSKPEIINDLNEWIREGLFISKNKNFWSECLRFVRNDRGQMQAQGKDSDVTIKSFDDNVIAAALMVRVALWMPNYRIELPKEPSARPFAEAYEKPSGVASY
jgi:hypothetical protein